MTRLREGGPFDSVLVLCIGNVCRSPYGERVLRRELLSGGADVVVRSAGFSGWDHPSPSDGVAEAACRDVDLTEHRSQVLTFELVDSTDLFLVTDRHQAWKLKRRFGVDPDRIVHLGDLDPQPIDTRTIEDPWGKEREVFRESYDRIDRCLEHLTRVVAERGAGGDAGESGTSSTS